MRSIGMLAVPVVAVALVSSGCALLLVGAGAAAGAGTVAYLQGELKGNQDAPLDRVLKAAELAVKDMGFTVTERTETPDRGKVVARGPGDKRVEVNLTKLTAKATEIRIRVGVFGDEDLSRQILGKIQKHL